MLLIFGLGYVGRAVAEAAAMPVTATVRDRAVRIGNVSLIAPEDAAGALRRATHLLVTAPPDADGDPLATRTGNDFPAPGLRWIGYLSTTGVYGDRDGALVDETTPPSPASERARRRVAAEADWSARADRCAVDIFRLAGIYGPGRSAFDDLRAGRARRIIKPGHAFGRIHRDDIVRAIGAAMARERTGVRILNLSDDEPAESAVVMEEAAQLLGMPPPPAIPFGEAVATMSPMARSFWAENRRVSSRATKLALGISWLYPSYREGLRAILAEERGEGSG